MGDDLKNIGHRSNLDGSMKRERIEDLGVIYQMLLKFLDENDYIGECNSKHTIDGFLKKYLDTDALEDLHNHLRSLNYFLYELLSVARGEEE